eukprot:UN04762
MKDLSSRCLKKLLRSFRKLVNFAISSGGFYCMFSRVSGPKKVEFRHQKYQNIQTSF